MGSLNPSTSYGNTFIHHEVMVVICISVFFKSKDIVHQFKKSASKDLSLATKESRFISINNTCKQTGGIATGFTLVSSLANVLYGIDGIFMSYLYFLNDLVV